MRMLVVQADGETAGCPMTAPQPKVETGTPVLWLDVSDIAQRLRISKKTVRKYARELGGVFVFGAWRFEPGRVEEWVAWRLRQDEDE